MNQLFYSDEYAKRFFRDNSHFASLCNGIYFHGKEVIKPEDLSPYESEKSTVINNLPVQSRGDIIKKVFHNQQFMLISIENQQEIDDAMPLRMLEYAYLDYHNQPREEKLLPVFGIVLYYGHRKWNGPKTLSSMLEIPEEMKEFFNDWKINLIEINDIDVELFHDQQVHMLVEGIQRLYSIKKGQSIGEWKIPVEMAGILANVTKTKDILKYEEEDKEGNVDMCESIDILMKECRDEGKSQGIEQNMIQMIINLMSTTSSTVYQAMDMLKVSKEKQEYYKELVNKQLS